MEKPTKQKRDEKIRSIEMSIKKVIEEKRNWKLYKARINSLPEEYQIVYKEIEKYLYKVCSTEGIVYDSVLSGVLELFEESSSTGRNVLEITGTDVATFCDNLLQ